MKILSFTTLYPNSVQPIHGIFVENRLRRLAEAEGIEVRVIAPVPWFPFRGKWAGRYGIYARVPPHEMRHGLSVSHPRYPTLPKIGMSIAPALLALSQRSTIAQILRDGYEFDVIDAHYFYPDGVAAALLGQWFRKPVVITGRGTDLSLIPQYLLPRRQIQWAIKRAAGLITVCEALKEAVIDLGAPAERVTALRNGVDLDLFHPFVHEADRRTARDKLGMKGICLVTVGHLVERKGQHLIIEALRELPHVNLYLIGDGPDRRRLVDLAQALGVADRTHFLGARAHEELPQYYSAADASVLASSREGWANVLLESMACGTPVVASRIWGTPEVVASAEAGVLMAERSAAGVAAGVNQLIAHLPSRAATRTYAERFSWDTTTAGQISLFQQVIKRGQSRSKFELLPNA